MKNLIGFLLAMCVAVSCKQDKVPFCEENPSECVDIRSVKDFMFFKVGTWWVYEEETTLVRDSVFVVEASEDTGTYNFQFKTENSLSDYNIVYWPEYYGSGNNDCVENGLIHTNCLSVRRSKQKPGDFVAENDCFFYTLDEGDFDYTSVGDAPDYISYKLIVEDVITNFQLSGNNLGFTYRMFEEKTTIENNQPTTHYYSKNIGLVRKELLTSGQVWNLVDFYIVQ